MSTKYRRRDTNGYPGRAFKCRGGLVESTIDSKLILIAALPSARVPPSSCTDSKHEHLLQILLPVGSAADCDCVRIGHREYVRSPKRSPSL